jgi:hypothetical protein
VEYFIEFILLLSYRKFIIIVRKTKVKLLSQKGFSLSDFTLNLSVSLYVLQIFLVIFFKALKLCLFFFIFALFKKIT